MASGDWIVQTFSVLLITGIGIYFFLGKEFTKLQETQSRPSTTKAPKKTKNPKKKKISKNINTSNTPVPIIDHSLVNKSDSEPDELPPPMVLTLKTFSKPTDDDDSWSKPKILKIKSSSDKKIPASSSHITTDVSISKKQKQNARKAELIKQAKQEEQNLQNIRLKEHRKNQEKSWLLEKVKEDKEAQRKKQISKGMQSSKPSTTDSWYSPNGTGLWDK